MEAAPRSHYSCDKLERNSSNNEGALDMNTEKKLFAFRLAEKQSASVDGNNGKWKARDGVAVAGCTFPTIVPPGYQLGVTSNSDTSVPC
jgi:hypothetical protein